ncbi:hypothetical protein Ancab_023140 [Ancistrocladus abbreviatus]
MNDHSINTVKPLDPKTLVDEASKVIDFIASYYENVEKYPVRSQVEPAYLKKLLPCDSIPYSPESMEAILEDVRSKILPGLTHWQSPNFFAYFQANASNAAFMGDMLCTGLNVNGFNWISSPAATELEEIVMDWMGEMLDLPHEFLFSGNGGGILHGSTCEAMLCTLAAARDKALNGLGPEGITKLVVYSSDQTHFSFEKSARLVGILPSNFRAIPTSPSNAFALSPDDVRAAMESDLSEGLLPLYLCATIGTTASCAVDPLKELGLVAKHFGAWLHVDAAYAGSACICPEYRHYLNGVELADSISINPHKWLLINMDCCCLWLKSPKTLVESLSTRPEILKNKASELNQVVDYKDWQMALSRRFRALKLWFVIRRYGLSNLMNHIRSDVELAKYFSSLVLKDQRFELVVPQMFALVCFRLRPKHDEDVHGTNEMNKKLLEAVNSSGHAYMIHAILGGKYVIRCAIGGTLTERCHIDGLWRLIQEKSSVLLDGSDHMMS